MSHNVFLESHEDENIEVEDTNKLIVTLLTFKDLNIKYKLKIDYNLVTLEEYVFIINLSYGDEDFILPSEIKTTKDLNDYIGAISALESVSNMK